MRKKLLLILAVTILVASTVVGCSEGSPCPSTLTLLSINEGEVLVMKDGTEEWLPAEQEMELDIGDKIKTAGNSSAEITFFDGSTMELEADTEIEILSLDIVCATGVTTVTLEQVIGTTINRVTAILDPASRYEIETPGGTVAVRGSVVIVKVLFNHLYYEDGTTLVTNVEGNVYAISQGVELQVPEGERCIMIPGQPPYLEPSAQIYVFMEEGEEDAAIRIIDSTLVEWAIDKDTGEPVNGGHHTTPDTITVAGGHNYTVWVEAAEHRCLVEICPEHWSIEEAFWGGQFAYGYLVADSLVSVSFILFLWVEE